ncbi:MAG: hypothetical protein D6795_13290 [Deltaproteobacteria bacterium]|nr:MAG: hypothetical protein D6795_13290 [Deltaproteobacteria bacterium]
MIPEPSPLDLPIGGEIPSLSPSPLSDGIHSFPLLSYDPTIDLERYERSEKDIIDRKLDESPNRHGNVPGPKWNVRKMS